MNYIESYEYFILNEDTSATGGPAGSVSSDGSGGVGVPYSNASYGGMGPVISPQPGSTPGTFGQSGSGDVSVPYNAGGKGVFQKVPIDNRKGNSKRRKNKLLSGLKSALGSRKDFTNGQGEVRKKKVMDFNDFQVMQISQVTKSD